MEALEEDAGDLLSRIIEYRDYAKAHHLYTQGLGMKPEDRPRGPAIEVVREIAFVIAGERIAAARQAEKDGTS